MQAIELHRLVEMAFNAGNADELADLYEDGATMATPEGEVVSGREDIRSQWSGFIALGGTIRMVTRYAIENDELALLSNEWFFTAEGFDLNSNRRDRPPAA